MKNNITLSAIIKILPPVCKAHIWSEIHLYGTAYQLAKKLNFSRGWGSLCGWLHGCSYFPLRYKEELIGNHAYTCMLVGTKSEEAFLQDKGVYAKAIGLPYIYADDFDDFPVVRHPNSLLVMPPHSLSYTHHNWNEDGYGYLISELSSKFDCVCVCLHSSCIDKGLWIKAFEKYNIPYVLGADPSDINALIRMRRLFGSFEYMTTNSFGSHIAYAAYSGCKVSVYGDYLEYRADDFSNDPLYQKHPEVLEHFLSMSDGEKLAKSFPFLFCHPKKAIVAHEWAAAILGKDNKIALEEIVALLDWTLFGKLKFGTKKIIDFLRHTR